MGKLSHINEQGEAHMVDVSQKASTKRQAIAECHVTMSAKTLSAIVKGNAPKGDVFATARIAGIMAAKQTHMLIPLCHPLPLEKITIDIQTESDAVLVVTATVITSAKTGVEMEAMTACTVAALTIYDMAKALDKAITITSCRLLEKTGGKSGAYSVAAHDQC